MRVKHPTLASVRARRRRAFTMAEFVISAAIVTIIYAGVVIGYTSVSRRAQWSGYSLAAESLAVKQIEFAHSALFDPASSTNQILAIPLLGSNYVAASQTITGYTWTNLDLPTVGTNIPWATNYVTITPIEVSGNTGVTDMMVRVDTVWTFTWKKKKLFTNTVATLIAPENKSESDLLN